MSKFNFTIVMVIMIFLGLILGWMGQLFFSNRYPSTECVIDMVLLKKNDVVGNSANSITMQPSRLILSRYGITSQYDNGAETGKKFINFFRPLVSEESDVTISSIVNRGVSYDDGISSIIEKLKTFHLSFQKLDKNSYNVYIDGFKLGVCIVPKNNQVG